MPLNSPGRPLVRWTSHCRAARLRSAMLAANSTELEKLAKEPGLEYLSGDLPVRTWMSVSNKSTAADQTRAGRDRIRPRSAAS